MLTAAFTSACAWCPQATHRKTAWLSRFAGEQCPQTLQVCDVYAGLTRSTRPGALSWRRRTSSPQPWARMLRLSPALARRRFGKKLPGRCASGLGFERLVIDAMRDRRRCGMLRAARSCARSVAGGFRRRSSSRLARSPARPAAAPSATRSAASRKQRVPRSAAGIARRNRVLGACLASTSTTARAPGSRHTAHVCTAPATQPAARESDTSGTWTQPIIKQTAPTIPDPRRR